MLLLLKGEAVALAPVGAPDPLPEPSHRYLGRLEPPSDGRRLTCRGSVLNGTAIASPTRLEENYPNDVISESHVEYLEPLGAP